MPEDFISLKEVLTWMDRGLPFSIRFATCNWKTGKGGEWVDISQAFKHNQLTAAEYARQKQLQAPSRMLNKDPRHYENSTRNLRLPNGEIRKVHIRLIRKFNGKTVL